MYKVISRVWIFWGCRFCFDLDEHYEPSFSIATKDLNLGSDIPDLIDIGVKSLKVEGRMRSSYYIATVISCYRKLIDAYYNNSFTDELFLKTKKYLDRVANRESTNQFYKGNVDFNDQYYIGREEVSNQDFLGMVLEVKNNTLILEQRNYFKIGDKVNIFTPSGEEYTFTIEEMYDEEDKPLECARHPRQIIKIPCDLDIVKNSIMRSFFW